MVKCVELSDEAIEIVNRAKEENALPSFRMALEHVIKRYLENQIPQIVHAVLEELSKNHLSIERLRWSTQTAEQNSIFILDALNTILQTGDYCFCIPVSDNESPVITASKEELRRKLAHFKQQADDKKAKYPNP